MVYQLPVNFKIKLTLIYKKSPSFKVKVSVDLEFWESFFVKTSPPPPAQCLEFIIRSSIEFDSQPLPVTVTPLLYKNIPKLEGQFQ